MKNNESGYYPCDSKINVCVLNVDWQAQVFNKENLEFAHFCLLEIIDEINDPLKKRNAACDFKSKVDQ